MIGLAKMKEKRKVKLKEKYSHLAIDLVKKMDLQMVKYSRLVIDLARMKEMQMD